MDSTRHSRAEELARLDAIRRDLNQRARQSLLPTEDMDERLAAWRAARDAGGTDNRV
ncbi:hypothetical protein [Ferruginivarius sediminum]|uniref:hypothetical protein n=1 Tax=Ferruginivarius sediminum TaxID=2661937 RepID=UPI001293EBBB|nr:hypothetical protein [Ferruginivarius sediminum]